MHLLVCYIFAIILCLRVSKYYKYKIHHLLHPLSIFLCRRNNKKIKQPPPEVHFTSVPSIQATSKLSESIGFQGQDVSGLKTWGRSVIGGRGPQLHCRKWVGTPSK